MMNQKKNEVFFDEERHIYTTSDKDIIIPNMSTIIKSVLGDKFSCVPYDIRQAALEKGKKVHTLLELHDRHLDFDSTQYGQYLMSWLQFLVDVGLIDKEFDLIEEPLMSTEHWFATKPDRMIDNIIIEIKTGDEYIEHRLQTALEQIVVEENYGIKIKKRWVVYLNAGTYRLVEHNNPKDVEYFKAINKVFQWKHFEK